MTDDASEYGRLLAERDRLVAEGADPADLKMPLRPVARLSHDRGADAPITEAGTALLQAIMAHSKGFTGNINIPKMLRDVEREAALSVPAPTLPALDAETLRRAINASHETERPIDLHAAENILEALRDAV